MRLQLAVILVLLLTPIRAHGSCIGPMTFVIDVEVRSCTTQEAFVSASSECLQPWMRELHGRMMKRERGGVIIEGTVHRRMEVTWYDGKSATVGASVPVAEDGQWLIRAKSNLSCDTIQPGTTMQLLLAKRCCDVLPPRDFSCWYGVDTLEPLPQPVTKVLQGR